MVLGSSLAFIFFWLTEMKTALRTYSLAAVVLLVAGMIHDLRKTITRDWGYLLLLSLMTTGFVHLSGNFMLTSLIQAGSSDEGQGSVLLAWVCWCLVFKVIWFFVALRATSTKLAPVFCFPFQLIVDLYDELVLSIIGWRRWYAFLFFLICRCALNLAYSSAAHAQFLTKMAKLNQKRKISRLHSIPAASSQFSLDKNLAAISSQAQILFWQNIFSERTSSLAVLLICCLNTILIKLGIWTPDSSMLFTIGGSHGHIHTLISHSLSTLTVLAYTQVAGLLLLKTQHYTSSASNIEVTTDRAVPTTIRGGTTSAPASMLNRGQTNNNRQRKVNFWDFCAVTTIPIIPQAQQETREVPHSSSFCSQEARLSDKDPQNTGIGGRVRPQIQKNIKRSSRSKVAVTCEGGCAGFPGITSLEAAAEREDEKSTFDDSGPPDSGPDSIVGKGHMHTSSVQSLEEDLFWKSYRRRHYLPSTTQQNIPSTPPVQQKMKSVWRQHMWFYTACVVAAVSEAQRQWERAYSTAAS
uniref:Uncharacterized protein n=1 Tax=Heterosigma akashiwo TaxID=2829 RepID=A0A7S3UQP5_HETAK